MDTTQAALQGGANLPVLARASGTLSAQAALAGSHNACVEGPAQGGGRFASSDCLGKKEGRKGHSREENVSLKGFLLDFLFARRGDT